VSTDRSTRKPQRLSAEDRRRTVLDAALALFAARGYEGASVDEIAAEAGITVAVIYRHFKSKEELHATVLKEQWESLLAYQAEVVLKVPPGRERMRVAYTSYFEWFQQHPVAWRLLFRELGGPKRVVEAHERVLSLLSQAIAVLLAAEDPADPRLATETGQVIVAEYLKGAMNSVARWWYDHPDVERQEIIDLLLDVTWDGLGSLGVEGKKPRRRG
jgi:AcrR family transcriptional regulator